MFSNNWFETNNIKESFDKLTSLIDVNSKLTMIEIGCFEGRSTCYFINNFLLNSNSIIYCIDTFGGSKEHSEAEKENLYEKFVSNIKTTSNNQKAIIKQGFSFDELCKLNIENIKADIIYIDGSHEACDVLADAILAWNCCKVGGYVIFDDYLWKYKHVTNSPKIAIDSFTNIYHDKIDLMRGWTSYQFIIRKNKN